MRYPEGKEFFKKAFYKMASTLISVSSWGFLLVFFMASYLANGSKISGDNWALVVSIGFAGFLGYRAHGKGKE